MYDLEREIRWTSLAMWLNVLPSLNNVDKYSNIEILYRAEKLDFVTKFKQKRHHLSMK